MFSTAPFQPSPSLASLALCSAPETRLMIAVLQDALATFQRGLDTSTRKEIEKFREVDRWFRGRDDDSPFSFENICGSLGLDAGCVRERLNDLRRRTFMNRAAVRNGSMPREILYNRRSWVAPRG